MKRAVIAVSIAVLLFSAQLFAGEEAVHSYTPKDGFVPDAATAIKIAEAVFIPIYGEKTINEEKPLKAELKDGVWVVEGSLNCPDGQRCLGGVAVAEISKANGALLRVSHGK